MSLSRLRRLGLGLAALILCALSLASAAIAGQGVLTRHALNVDGVSRSYWLYEPSGRAGEVLPLVVAFHGGGGQADRFVTRAGLVAAAEREGFMLLAPQGLAESWRYARPEDGTMSRKAETQAGDDLAFMAALAAAVIPGLNVEAEFHLAGLSAGGMMAYYVACERPGGMRVATLVAISTTMNVRACPRAQGVSLMHVYGTADTNVPWSGGGGSFFTSENYRPIPEGLNAFLVANGCDPIGPELLPPGDYAATCTSEDMRLTIVARGEHGWFFVPELDATGRLAAFIRAH